ncbi:hypothetical protein ABEB36_006314 [Hypothenemus hampei]
MECKCDVDKEVRMRILKLEMEKDELLKRMQEKTLELAKYEEQNRNCCQKVDILSKRNADLMTKSRKIENSLTNLPEIKKTSNLIDDQNPPNLSYSNSQFREKQSDLILKLEELENLRSTTIMQREEIERLTANNNKLREEMEQLCKTNEMDTSRLQEMLRKSQNQVDMLLKEHDNKTAQIEGVANELDNIRKSVTDDAENCVSKVRQLEKERDALQMQLVEVEICQCEEIERLKTELCKKQCIIAELEKSVENFNENLQNFNKTAEELAAENSCLRAERDQLLKTLESTQTKENKSCQREMDKLRATVQKLELELANMYNFKTEVSCKTHSKRTYPRLNTFHILVEQLKNDHAKRESSKIQDLQKGYDEVKRILDQASAENEKLYKELQERCEKNISEMDFNIFLLVAN